MAIAALVLWMCSAAVGGYLLAASAVLPPGDDPPGTPRLGGLPVPPNPPGPPGPPGRDRHRFDPPSLTRAKSEPLPGMRALAEFAHPALALIGLGFWLGYVLSRDRMFAAIGLGILLGAICAGLSWALANARRRPGALRFPPRLLILHGLGAALTLLLAALIVAARV